MQYPEVTAKIIVHSHEIALGRSYLTFEWDGPAWGVISISGELLCEIELKYLPWELVKVDYRAATDSHYYARADVARGLWAKFVLECNFVRSALSEFKARLIMTAHVWGLAYVPENCYPDWEHIGKKRR